MYPIQRVSLIEGYKTQKSDAVNLRGRGKLIPTVYVCVKKKNITNSMAEIRN